MATRPPLLNDSVTGTCLPFIRGWCYFKVIITEGKQILGWKKFTDGLVSSLVTNDVKFIKTDSLGMVSANEQRFTRPSFFHGIVKPLHIKQSGLRKIYAVFVISLRIIYTTNFDLFNGYGRPYMVVNGNGGYCFREK
jgi:hypothetical protein